MTNRSSTPAIRILLVAIGTLAVGFLGVVLALGDLSGTVLFVTYVATGLFLAARRPRLATGWLLVVIGMGIGLGSVRSPADPATLIDWTAGTAERLAAWLGSVSWSMAIVAITLLVFVFPDEPLPGPRHRPVAFGTTAGSILLTTLILFGPKINIETTSVTATVDIANPLALPLLRDLAVPGPDVLYSLCGAIFVVGVADLVLRYRRSSGVRRLQFRWLAWAIVVVAIVSLIWAIVTVYLKVDDGGATQLAFALAYPLIPVAVAAAVLRYRLWEIDRLVSRTLGWGLATATVLGMFVVVVLALQSALWHVTQGQTLAVAASTLLAFAMFQPVRSRVQALVDRRFDRPRIQAERTLADHGERLAHETDLPTIEQGVLDTVATTLRPSTATVWIRGSSHS